ncbi:MAG: outer-membrane lipoprotein carrier protein LolA [Asticcacaulis sp.]
MNRRVLLSVFLAALLAPAAASPALAKGRNDTATYIVPPKFNAADQARITKATAYLQALATGQGRFEQTDYRGRITNGNWFLARPGKIRFEYDAPSSLLIVSDGKQVKMWDPRLRSFDKYPLDETPLSLFLSKQIRFDQGVVITQVTSNATGFTLKARDRRKQIEGSVTLSFAQGTDGNLALRDWTVVDAQSHGTTVKLTSFDRGMSLRPDLFVLNSPVAKNNLIFHFFL